jgi:hypothetical protein
MSLTAVQMLANQKHFEHMMTITHSYMWKDENELFIFENGKIIPRTQNGNRCLRAIVSKSWATKFIKS